MTDPIAEAISSVITEVMKRGVSVQPQGEGWVIRLSPETSEAEDQSDVPQASYLRSW